MNIFKRKYYVRTIGILELIPNDFIQIITKYLSYDYIILFLYFKENNRFKKLIIKIIKQYIEKYWLKELKKLDLNIKGVKIQILNNIIYLNNGESYDIYIVYDFEVTKNFNKLYNYQYNEELYKNSSNQIGCNLSSFNKHIEKIDVNTEVLCYKKRYNIIYYDFGKYVYKFTNFLSYKLKDKLDKINKDNNFENFLKEYINTHKFNCKKYLIKQ